MDRKVRNRILIMASLLLLAAGVIFLCLRIFGENKSTMHLTIALSCILLSNLFNVIRTMCNKEK